MTESIQVLQITEDDVCKILAAKAHIGDASANFQMKSYTHPKANRTGGGAQVIDIGRMWEKLMLAARAIVAIENPMEVIVVSTRPSGQRAILKFANYTGATSVAGRFTPGKFTNQQQTGFVEPRLLVTCDPIADHQAITESSFVNLPVIAMANTNSPLKYVDIAIPCNNQGHESLGLMWWFLAREVLRLRGSIGRTTEWDVWPDLFIYREPEEEQKDEEAMTVDPTLPKFEDLSAANKPSADVGTQWQDGTSAPVDEWAALGADDWGAAATPARSEHGAPTTREAADDWTVAPGQGAVNDWNATNDNVAKPATNDWSEMPVDNKETTDWSAPVVDDWSAANGTADGWGAH